LLLASLFEVVWAVGLKSTAGFTRLWPSAGVLVALVASVLLLAQAAKSIPIGSAYAVWTGLGTAGAVTCVMIFFGEPVTPARVISLALILAGVVGLKLA
jgi:quaternary ammonium compound-resistance protein SugE